MHLRPTALLVLAALLSCIVSGCAKRATPVEEATRTQTLYIGNHAEPRDLDPHIDVAYTDYNVLIGLFEGLTVIDEATSKPIPGIAEGWDITGNGLVYTFHLRRDAVWSNGDPVTADDFAFSIQRILTPAIASENSYLFYPVAGAEDFNLGKTKDFSTVGVRVLDPHTLQLTLARPTPYFLAITSHQAWFPVHRATLEKFGGAFDRSGSWTKPQNFVCNGPYVLEEWLPDQRLVLKKNPKYWNAAQTKAQRVVFFPIANSQVEESNFRTGQMHITYDVLPDRIDTYLKENKELIRVDPFLETYFLRFNVTRPPFTDKRVRQALARAIDREAIAKSVMRGSRVPAYCMTPPKTAGYTCSARIPTDYNEARRLLAEAGFPGGKGFPKMEIQMDADPINLVVFEAIQQMWRKELNIDVSLTQMEFRVYLDNMHHLAYQMTRSRWVGDYNDPETFSDLFISNSGNNDTGWKNPEYDALIAQAGMERDDEKRFAILQKAEALLLDEAPVAPIFFGTRTYLISPHVKGWVPSLLGIHRYQTVWLE
ncbi:MAG TPA: peptide ABC transporter substrate-binding protein [Opitutaceae bacterium]|nr:peptide ABC transporter substrate-binding protein [Opitutaceae bacterium]